MTGDPLGAPVGSAVRARVAAERLPTVGRWDAAPADDGREWVAIDDIAGVAELADEYGVRRTTISNWAARYPDFPPPLRVLAAGPIYSRRAVRRWHDAKAWQHAGPGTRHRPPVEARQPVATAT